MTTMKLKRNLFNDDVEPDEIFYFTQNRKVCLIIFVQNIILPVNPQMPDEMHYPMPNGGKI